MEGLLVHDSFVAELGTGIGEVEALTWVDVLHLVLNYFADQAVQGHLTLEAYPAKHIERILVSKAIKVQMIKSNII